ncbi:hypothetical protein F1559_003275 [Cyanidiococcus yangmingshanensis]|uniref:Uncharacterized protein n=1 Tax=Cyanidiococcus yangmingshanensis TaxID=2690220 RepID=A0A7J7IDX5_9RHOD|nr:hypothetical protein F1559_003275 [Cyanidiococcus yangmingshanensis]
MRVAHSADSVEDLLHAEAAEALKRTTGEILRCFHVLRRDQFPVTGQGPVQRFGASGETHLTPTNDSTKVDIDLRSGGAPPVSETAEDDGSAVDWGVLLGLVQDVLLFLGEWDECLNPSFGDRVGGLEPAETPTLDWYMGNHGAVTEAGLVPLAARRAVLRTGVLEAGLEVFARLVPPSSPEDMIRSQARPEQLERLLFGIMKLIVVIALPLPASIFREAEQVLGKTTAPRQRHGQTLHEGDEWTQPTASSLDAALSVREALEELHSGVLRLGTILIRQWTECRDPGVDAPSCALEWVANLFIGAARTLPSSWPCVELCLLFFATFMREPTLLDPPVSCPRKRIPAAFERETRHASRRQAMAVAQQLLLLLMRPNELDLLRVIHAVVMKAPHIGDETDANACGTADSVLNAALEIYHAAWVRFYPAHTFAAYLFTEMRTEADRQWSKLFGTWEPLREKLERERALRDRQNSLVRPSRWAMHRASAWVFASGGRQLHSGAGSVPVRKRVALNPEEVWDEVQRNSYHAGGVRQRDWHGERARRADLGLLKPENAAAFYHARGRVGTLAPSWTRLAALSLPEPEPGLGQQTAPTGGASSEAQDAATSWRLWTREAGLAMYELGRYGMSQLERAAQDASMPPWTELTAFLELSSAALELHFWEQATRIVAPFECERSRAVLLLLGGYSYGPLPDDLSAWPSLHTTSATRDATIVETLHRQLTRWLYHRHVPDAMDEGPQTGCDPSADGLVMEHSDLEWQRAFIDLLLSDRALQATLRILSAAMQARKKQSRRQPLETDDLYDDHEDVDETGPDCLPVARSVPFETMMRFVFLQWRALIAEVDGLRRLRSFWCTHRAAVISLPRLIQQFDGRRCSRLHLDQVISMVWFLWFISRNVLSVSGMDDVAESTALAQELQRGICEMPRLGHCLLLPLHEALVNTWPAMLYRTSGWLRALDLLQQVWSVSTADSDRSTAAPPHMFTWHAVLVCAAAFERSAEKNHRQQGALHRQRTTSSSSLQDIVQLGLSLARAWQHQVVARPLVVVEALAALRTSGRSRSTRAPTRLIRHRHQDSIEENGHEPESDHAKLTPTRGRATSVASSSAGAVGGPATARDTSRSAELQTSVETTRSSSQSPQARHVSSRRVCTVLRSDTSDTSLSGQYPGMVTGCFAGRMRDRNGRLW